jgi:hypothetical protein
MLYFRCEFQEPYVGTYGSKNVNGTWDGAIGMIEDYEADVGLNVLDFEQLRLDVVDYFPPLWNLK